MVIIIIISLIPACLELMLEHTMIKYKADSKEVIRIKNHNIEYLDIAKDLTKRMGYRRPGLWTLEPKFILREKLIDNKYVSIIVWKKEETIEISVTVKTYKSVVSYGDDQEIIDNMAKNIMIDFKDKYLNEISKADKKYIH